MLNFDQHMWWIISLAGKAKLHTEQKMYPMTRDDLIRIGIHCNEALQQLDELVLIQHQGKNPAERVEG